MEWKDYYAILGDVGPDSSKEDIKKQYWYKANILAPDKNGKLHERMRQKAEEDFKKVNAAWEVLSDPEEKRKYDIEWAKRKAGTQKPPSPKPVPVTDPPTIVLDLASGEIKRTSFIIRNIGGPCNKVQVELSQPDTWVRVLGYARVSSSSAFPLKAEIEAKAGNPGRPHVQYVRIRLDAEETQVRIEIQTKPEAVKEKPSDHVSNNPTQKVRCPKCNYMNDKYVGTKLRIYCDRDHCLHTLDSNKIKCPNCKKIIPAAAPFCPECGHPQK